MNSSNRISRAIGMPATNVRKFLFMAIATIAVFGPPGPLRAESAAPVATAPASFADLAESVLPAVVNITVTKTIEAPAGIEDFLRRFDPRRRDEEPSPPPRRRAAGGGSGFIIEETGLIVTNNHVVEGAEEITVRLDSMEEFKAELVGTDAPTDLAILRIKVDRALPTLPLGDSDATRIGDWVLTVGSPFGLGGTVTAGIVSARNRDINTGLYDDFLQTDAPINPGNSGGPLVDMNGKVVGINTAIFSPSGGNAGVGFAIPSNLARTVIDQLLEKGSVQRGWLGVSFQPITRELADSLGLEAVEGVLVASVATDGPAEKAGVQSGDVILEYDGNRITPTMRLPAMVANTPIGKRVKIVVLRKNERKTLTVRIVERDEEQVRASFGDAPPGGGDEVTVLGLTLGALSDDIRDSLGLPTGLSGVVIMAVDPASDAQAQGLRRGDVIVTVSLEDVASPEDVVRRIEEVRKANRPSVLLRVYRGGNYSHITVPLN